VSSSLLSWFLLRLDQGSAGYTRAVAFLEAERHNRRAERGVAHLRGDWQRSAMRCRCHRNADAERWLGLVAEMYYNTTCAAIRRHDDGAHLILGYRGFSPVSPSIVRAAANCVDVIDWHVYTTAAPLHDLELIHNLSGLPVMVSEFGFKALASGLLNTYRRRRPHPQDADAARGGPPRPCAT